jgi:hypothetical protein
MDSNISKNTTLLANKIINLLIEKTNGDLRNPLPFLFAYEPSRSIHTNSTDSKFDNPNLMIRQHIMDHLLKNELISISPENVKGVYVTQKALDQYPM